MGFGRGTIRWDLGVVPLDKPSPGAVKGWWCYQGSEVLKECLESDGAGLHEPRRVASDVHVLGSGISGASSMAIDKIQPIERARMKYLSNLEWAKEKHNARVLIACKLHDYAHEWKKVRPDATTIARYVNKGLTVVTARCSQLMRQILMVCLRHGQHRIACRSFQGRAHGWVRSDLSVQDGRVLCGSTDL